MRRLTLTVTPEQAGRTVRSLLRRELRMADGAIARVKTVPDGICLNGAHARTVDRVAAGDTLTVRIDDKRSGGRFTPVAVPLDILYEDADLLALNKPAGMAVHGGYDRGDPTVANALAAYLGPDAIFHPVNRLDRGTSGVMLVARSGYVHDRLRRVLHTDGFRRTYLAVACGVGLLLRVTPRTGRTHQIRVHFAALGHPLLGDALYGGDASLLARPALHSAAADLTQPVTGQLLHITAPVPDDLRVFGFERYL